MDGRAHLPRQPYLFQPVKTLTPFSFSEVMEEVRSTFLPELEEPVEVRIIAAGPLAFISPHHMGRDRHMVAFHPILNHPDTPIEVVRLIAKHELAHTRVPSGFHTAEFWEIEHAIGPERYAVWHWINESLRGATRNGGGFRVFTTWRGHFKGPRAPYTPHLPLDPERYEGICPGDGQMMLPPDWVRKPQPIAPGTLSRAETLASTGENSYRGVVTSGDARLAPAPVSEPRWLLLPRLRIHHTVADA